MKHLLYKNIKNRDELFVEDVSISEISQSVPTPFYCYSKKSLIENYQKFSTSFDRAGIKNYKICYAIKANFNINLVKILAELGCGIDAVSAGEIDRSIKAGIEAKKIVFAGVGKTRQEIEFAIQAGVEEFSAESLAEIFMLNEVAAKMNKKIKFSLRVNPDVDAKTHAKISTGKKGDKFGVDINEVEKAYSIAAKLPNLELYGVSTHIGSQITDIKPFETAFYKLKELFIKLKNNGHNLKNIDFGGGIGILYKNENTILINEYAKLIKEITANLDVDITIAPGRAIVGDAAIMVSKVILLKETKVKNFLIIDAAMNDLMRPGLYGSYHEVLQVKKRIGSKVLFDIAGPVCESTDILATQRELVDIRSDDLIAFASAGAYGSSMSNSYNCRPLIPEILVDGNKFKIIRRRPTFEEMIELENI